MPQLELSALRQASESDGAAVYALYQSVIGEDFCVWNERYPSFVEIEEDIKNNGLFLLERDGHLLGAISIVPHNELDAYAAWQIPGGREIARLVVAKEARGRRLSLLMIDQLRPILRADGAAAIRLSVALSNIPAYHLYCAYGFVERGQAELWGSRYVLMEYKL